MSRRSVNTRFLCLSAIIAALYAGLTLCLPALSYGALQCRLSEALTLLPLVLPQAVPGLAVGCLVANLLSPVGLWDVLFGTLATLVAALCTRKLRQHPLLAAACPVICNGLIIGPMLSMVYQLPALLTIGQVAAGEAVAVFIGYGLMNALKNKIDWNKLR